MRAILVGSDMSASNLEFGSYSELLESRIESIRERRLKGKVKKNSSEYNFNHICRSASDDYRASNQFFVSNESIDDPVVVFLSFSRLLANAKEERDVSDFRYIYNLDENFHKRALKKIKLLIPEWEESILRKTFFAQLRKKKNLL